MTIVLVNGPFGVGKSTIAKLVVDYLASSVVFDPELIGAYLHRVISPAEMPTDYQDLELWRHLNADFARRLHADTNRHVIVPMALRRFDHFTVITSAFANTGINVLCLRLTCSAEALTSRILGRRDEDGGHAWGLAHLDSGLASANDVRFGIEVDTEGRTPTEIALGIVSMVIANSWKLERRDKECVKP